MKKIQTANTLKTKPDWRRLGAAAMLVCAMTGTVPVHAQDPSANQATLNFVGADVESVIKAIGHYTGNTFIIDPRVKGTISVVTEKPVSKAQALDLLGSALRLQGFAMVRTAGLIKVVPEADAKVQAGTVVPNAVRGDQIATQIFRLNYESAANMVPVLRPLISPNNTINANPGTNSIVITDYADNLRRLGRIISALDAPATADLDVVPIRHAMASDIATMVNRLIEPSTGAGAAGGEAGKVGLMADNRTNSVIIRAPSQARANLAKSLIAKLDQPTANPGNVHVVYLRNADAVKLAQTLRAVVASDSSIQGTGTPGAQNQQQAQLQQTGQNQSQLASGALGQGGQQGQQTPASLPTGGPAGFIQADPSTNTIIITASEAVYRNLRAVIDQLDARRAQVYVESLIVEVPATKAAELGIQWLGLSGDATSNYRVGGGTAFSSAGNNIINQAAATAAPNGVPLAPGNGLTLGVFRQIGGRLGLGALARALETDTNANILSVPNLITLDNEEARIIVGQNVPFITGQFTTAASGGAAGVNPFQTIERRDVGLALRVRPQISEGGTIKLQIYQETSAVQDTTNVAGIITSKRSIESNVLVDDGQVIVLGGLIEDRMTDTVEKVPGLGDIPVLGGLFKYQTRRYEKTNLMIFLRPTVIRNAEQSANVMTDRYDYIRNVQAGQQVAPSLVLPNGPGPMLPPLIDGRPFGAPMVNVQPRNEEGMPPEGGVQPIPPVPDPGAAPPPTNRNQER